MTTSSSEKMYLGYVLKFLLNFGLNIGYIKASKFKGFDQKRDFADRIKQELLLVCAA